MDLFLSHPNVAKFSMVKRRFTTLSNSPKGSSLDTPSVC